MKQPKKDRRRAQARRGRGCKRKPSGGGTWGAGGRGQGAGSRQTRPRATARDATETLLCGNELGGGQKQVRGRCCAAQEAKGKGRAL